MKLGGVLASAAFGFALSMSSGNAAVAISGNFVSDVPVLSEAGGATFVPPPPPAQDGASVGCPGCGGSGPGDPPPGVPEPAIWAMIDRRAHV